MEVKLCQCMAACKRHASEPESRYGVRQNFKCTNPANMADRRGIAVCRHCAAYATGYFRFPVTK